MPSEDQVIDAEETHHTETAVAVREKNHVPALAREVQPLTPQQAKVDAVANLTFKAYERASTLALTDAELAKLQEDFPDNAFRLGAGGDANLIYIEHAHLRDRLNRVFGPGQWSIIPRNRWNEDYKTADNKPAVRVYVEAMLLVRGCFVAEAVGDMSYYPGNAKTNYGDAVEGAKSACLRRCAKELGIGLQAWKKDFCEGWKQRQRNPAQRTYTQPTQQARTTASSPTAGDDVPMDFGKPEEKKPEAASKPKAATAETRKWMLGKLAVYGDDTLKAFAQNDGILLPTEALKDWPLHKVPTSTEDLNAMMQRIDAWKQGAAPEQAQDAPEQHESSGFPSFTGTIEQISVKEGTKGTKTWRRFGIKIEGEWYNTFDATIGGEADQNKGQRATVTYEETKFGRELKSFTLAEVAP